MKLKGHTKIELFNAKTGELEQCVEDDNMFTNAIDSLLNDNLSGLLVGRGNITPLHSKGLGGLLLLPQTEQENINNIWPHSIPTGVGCYNRTDAGTDPMMGIYNTEESGFIEGGYKHIWEFMTSKGNGNIACAALTNYYATTEGFATYSRQFTGTELRVGARSSINILSIAGFIKGKMIGVTLDASGTLRSDPTFLVYNTHIMATECNSMKDKLISDSSPLTNNTLIGSFKLPQDYTSIFNSNKYFRSGYSIYPYTEGKAILLYTIINPNRERTDMTQWRAFEILDFFDVYIVDLDSFEATFVRTITFPSWTCDTSGNIEINTNLQSSRLISYNRVRCHLVSPNCEGRYGYNTYMPCYNLDTHELIYAACPIDLYRGSDPPSRILLNNNGSNYGDCFIVKINVLTAACETVFIKELKNYPIRTGVGYSGGLDSNYYSMQQIGRSPLYAIGFKCDNVTDGVTVVNGWHYILFNASNMTYKIDNGIDFKQYNQNVNPLFTYRGVSIYARWESANNYAYEGGAHYIGSNMCPIYMATINNLPTPITKTSDQTMKVTYTIMDAEEEKV